ncbi:MAG: transaldolase family protein [Bacteroidia bacterium]
MQLYFESSDLREAEKLVKSGIVNGLIANPDLMNRYGNGDTDSLIIKLSKLSEHLQIEPKGETFEVWITEVQRLISLGLDKEKTYFSLPVTLHGIKACNELSAKGIKVSINFVYTLHQAYLAMNAGAKMINVMVGELQEKGYDGLSILDECIKMRDSYNYPCKVMLASANSMEHMRNALHYRADAIAVPNSLLLALQENMLINPGAEKFIQQKKLHSLKVKDILKGNNPQINVGASIVDAVVEMTKGGMGAIAVLEHGSQLKGVFTDGDLRRLLQSKGDKILQTRLSELSFKEPVTIDAQSSLQELSTMFKNKRIDNILVTSAGELIGMVDIQDLNL